jgi:hypothetical protein
VRSIKFETTILFHGLAPGQKMFDIPRSLFWVGVQYLFAFHKIDPRETKEDAIVRHRPATEYFLDTKEAHICRASFSTERIMGMLGKQADAAAERAAFKSGGYLGLIQYKFFKVYKAFKSGTCCGCT